MEGEFAGAFRERAAFEAARYGANPWVFVRELLQNSRDAGARSVWFSVESAGGTERIGCRDDGCGMTFDHARRYLFTLYASSKRDQAGAAGRFGIGFWSVLRFAPTVITVRSRTSDGEGWEVSLDGDLEHATVSRCVMLPGTEVALERAGIAADLETEVLGAVRGDGRFLRCRDAPEQPLDVTVNGRPATAEFGLPPPSLSFRRPGLRGAVALAGEPKVEVFAHGLRVRSASFLDELLLADRRPPPPTAELPDGLVPQVVLDGDQLQVLMARGDTREDRAVRRMVTTARGELARLVRDELDRWAPKGRLARLIERLGEGWRMRSVRWSLVAALVGGLLGSAAGLVLQDWGLFGVARGPTTQSVAESMRPAVPPTTGRAGPSPYRDLDGSTGLAEPVALEPYRGSPCVDDCLEVMLEVAAPSGVLRLPVATGHLIDPATVRLDGERPRILATPTGEPALWFVEEQRGRVRYVSGPAPEPEIPPGGSWPPLPDEIAERADLLLALPVSGRVDAATDLVRSRIAYDRSSAVAKLHLAELRRGTPLFDRALAIGAGDCDVQNALLAAVLDRSAVPARLAVGYVGFAGRVRPGQHAWVEYLDGGRWRVADASVGGPGTAPADASSIPRSPPTAAAPGRGVASGRSAKTVPLRAVAPLAAALALAGLIAVLIARRGRRLARAVHSEGDTDLARLLRGALLRPEAYRDIGSLYSRRVVPLVSGGGASLRRGWRLARSGRLYRSDHCSELAIRAASRGVTVIDSGRDEGRVVADLLGARDLDAWDGVLERSRSHPVTGRLEEALRRLGERWRVRVVSGAPEPVAVFEGEPLGFERASRLVAVDAESRLWEVVEGARDRIDWAALLLGEGAARVADMEAARRRRLLEDLARRAVMEKP
jgi:hypothetical protein